jgi:hypothetical protein
MEVAKPGALTIGSSLESPVPVPVSDAGTAGKSSSAADQRLRAAVASSADQLDISALDVAAALRILIAEVRQAIAAGLLELLLPSRPVSASTPFDLAAPDTAVPAGTAANAVNPEAAAGLLLATFLAAVPAGEGDDGAWMETVARLEQASVAGCERAAAIITAWRDVTPQVIAAVHASQTLFIAALTNAREPDMPMRAEWLAVAPRLARFRRRRRALQRRLEDPDHRNPQAVAGRVPGEAVLDDDTAGQA